MKVAVTGGTGMVGKAVVRELLNRGVEVQILTRSAEKARGVPEGVQAVVGDLLDPETVRSFFKGVDSAFLLNAVSPTETHEALMALNGIRDGGVRRVVYLSVQDAEMAPHVPHYGSKVGVEAAIRCLGIPHTILRPNNFFQNDLWLKRAMLEGGRYTQPIGSKGLSRVDVRDIAEAAAITATTPRPERETVDLVGPECLTGADCAGHWAAALRRPIEYAGDDLAFWARKSGAHMPPWMIFDFERMYAHFQREGMVATSDAIRRVTQLLGHPPRSLAAYTREMAAEWISA